MKMEIVVPEVKMAPCPFCGNADDLEIDDSDENEMHVYCENCFAEGPQALLGCRDEDGDEEGPIDLEREAVELWNQRYEPVTVEEICEMAPSLEKSIAELERTDPEVLAARERLDRVQGSLGKNVKAFMDALTPKERALVERRFSGKEEK